MRKFVALAGALVLALILSVGAVAGDVIRDIQPNAIAMGSKGGTASVHTVIGYSPGGWTASLSGIPAYLVKADDCGNVVAKFDIDAVKALVESQGTPSQIIVVFTLTGPGGSYSESWVLMVAASS